MLILPQSTIDFIFPTFIYQVIFPNVFHVDILLCGGLLASSPLRHFLGCAHGHCGWRKRGLSHIRVHGNWVWRRHACHASFGRIVERVDGQTYACVSEI